MVTTRRALTPDERAALEAGLRYVRRPFTGLAHAFIVLAGLPTLGLLAGGLIGGFLERLGLAQPIPQIAILAGVSVGLGIAVATALGATPRVRREAEKYREDLALGELEVIEASVTDAVRVEEAEDEGPGYFLEIGGGNLVFLQDQSFNDLEDEQRFPSRRITITRSIHSDGILQVEPAGDYFRPSRERAPLATLPHRPGVAFPSSLADV